MDGQNTKVDGKKEWFITILNLDLQNQVTQVNLSPCSIKEIIFFCKHWTEICKQLFTFRKSVIGLCPKVIIWMAFYGAVAGCTLEKKYEHDNTRTMNLIRNFLQFLLFYKSDFYQRENTNWEALFQWERVVGKSKLMLESPNAFGKFEVGDIDVGEGCWRRNVLMPTSRCERRNIQKMSLTSNTFQGIIFNFNLSNLKLSNMRFRDQSFIIYTSKLHVRLTHWRLMKLESQVGKIKNSGCFMLERLKPKSLSWNSLVEVGKFLMQYQIRPNFGSKFLTFNFPTSFYTFLNGNSPTSRFSHFYIDHIEMSVCLAIN